jgi:hypothetical protein
MLPGFTLIDFGVGWIGGTFASSAPAPPTMLHTRPVTARALPISAFICFSK